jgi:hypothetical protein
MKLSGSDSVKQNRHTRRERSGAGLFSIFAGVLLSSTVAYFGRSKLGHNPTRARSTALGKTTRHQDQYQIRG